MSEFITDGVTGRLVPFLEPDRIADAVLELLEDRKQARRLGQGARGYAEAELSLQDYLQRYDVLVKDVVSRF